MCQLFDFETLDIQYFCFVTRANGVFNAQNKQNYFSSNSFAV